MVLYGFTFFLFQTSDVVVYGCACVCVCVCVCVMCAAALWLQYVDLLCALCLPFAFGICPVLSALCHMPLALYGPVRFYVLFVSGI